MFWRRLSQLTVVALGVVGYCSLAAAQAPLSTEPRPVSSTGGWADRELRSVYRQSIGQGYTGESLNQIALRNAQARVPNFGQSTTGGGSIGLGISPSRTVGDKPFANYSPGPTVSPYLNLFREDLSGESDFNYQTLVRPQLDQQRFNEQMQRQALANTRRLQQIGAQAGFPMQGSQQVMPTGHRTLFMYHGRFFPAPARR